MSTVERAGETTSEGRTRDPLEGRLLAGKYLLEERVGVGAMGAVYRATQQSLDRTVAVKVLLPELTTDPSFNARFVREARAASRLEHPHSVAVLDFGSEPDGTSYLVMEYLEGHTLLSQLEEKGRLDPVYASRVMAQVLAALAVAHDLGVVHRDLKPENIMLATRYTEEGVRTEVAKVADFGIASVADARVGLTTRNGLVAGTPEYMSPEQGQGLSVDGRSDLYSCGVLLYQLITGTLPFEADSALAVMMKHLCQPPDPPSSRYADTPPELERIILRAMQKDPAARFADAREMRAAICEYMALVNPADQTSRFSVLSLGLSLAPPAPPPSEPGPRAVSTPVPGAIDPVVAGLGSEGRRPTTTNAPAVVSAARASIAPAVRWRTRPLAAGGAVLSLVVALSLATRSHVAPSATSAAATSVAPSAGLLLHATGVVRDEANAPSVAEAPTTTTASVVPGTDSPSSAFAAPRADDDARAAGALVAQTPRHEARNSRSSHPRANARSTSPHDDLSPEAVVAQTFLTQNEAALMSQSAPTPAALGPASSPALSGASAAAPSPAVLVAPSSTPDPSSTPPPPALREVAVEYTPSSAQPSIAAHAPVPRAEAVTGLQATVVRLDAPPGLLRHALVGRVDTATRALARCVFSSANYRGELDVLSRETVARVVVTVRDRRVDEVSVRGPHTFYAECERTLRDAFTGDLPAGADVEYTLGLSVALAPTH